MVEPVTLPDGGLLEFRLEAGSPAPSGQNGSYRPGKPLFDQ